MKDEELKVLLTKYKEGMCTDEEKALLENWVSSITYPEFRISEEELLADLTEICSRIPLVPVKERKRWPRIAAAASILLALGIGFYFLGGRFGKDSIEITQQPDILPGDNKATLILTDGRRIELSSEKEGISLQSGDLTYTDGTDLENSLTEYATLTTPRGGQYQVVLPDGSKVWLNAASSLTYPTSFSGLKVRRVELSGEGYFEVAKDAERPFLVSSEQQTVEVLGTHFNVNVYPDEPASKTTLLEGKVRMRPAGGTTEVILTPGDQAVRYGDSFRVLEVDVEEAVAWRNGMFLFTDRRLEDIMKMVSRWYDVEVDYTTRGIMDQPFSGGISRSEHLSQLLQVLESTDLVHFEINGRTITVSPAPNNESN